MKFTLHNLKAREAMQGYRLIRDDSAYVHVSVRNTVHKGKDASTPAISMRELVRKLSHGFHNADGVEVPPRPLFQDYKNSRRRWLRAQVLKYSVFTRVNEHSAQGSATRLQTIRVSVNTKALAQAVTKDFKKWLRSGDYYKAKVPNAPYTIAKKGGDVPLIDTEQLVNAIYSETIKRNGKPDA